ncbi:beta-glucoside-specific PTS transporter subunit IIABC [Sanguibacter sp. 25GB23B1]|uniref:beta-glucoside-specific PTS transporter subunit IIABC n=1 Tax=unclassified Sanguibacter TaxID=2645534 RepID=UPI0032B003A5
MATASKHETTAAEVLRAVGGTENVRSVTHCATRLRFQLADRAKVDKAAVEATQGVITVVESGGQFQVVVGNNVGKVYEALTASGDLSAEGPSSSGILAKAIDLITSIFTPFLWVLAASGLLKALLAVWANVVPEVTASPTYAILFTAGDAIFQFLPILLAVTAAKKFRANVYTALAIASALIYSATVAVIPNAEGASVTLQAFAAGGEQLTFLSIPVIMVSYLSAVIPTILAIYAQGHLERLLDRVLPDAIRNFVTPMLVLVIIVPLTFLAIGPVADWVGTGLSDGVNWFWGLSPAVGGALMGAFWQVFVIFGVHWGFVPVMVQDLATQGYSLISGPLFAAVLAQAGAAAAVLIKTRNRELKGVAGPASISAFLAGVTEPAIYGVTLRLKKPFIYACIGGAVGGAIAAAGGSAAEGFVLPGAITLTSTLNVGNFTLQLVGTGLAMVIAFVLTLVLGFTDIPEPGATKVAPGTADARREDGSQALSVAAPVAGQVIPLSAVNDKVFSSGALGTGLAVIPSEGKAFAPISGTLLTVMPHAFGIRADDGLEVLVHVGLNTVELDGVGFVPAVRQGDTVRSGDLLVTFDIDAIVAAGYDPVTVMLVTNAARYTAVVPVTDGEVRPNEQLLEIVS